MPARGGERGRLACYGSIPGAILLLLCSVSRGGLSGVAPTYSHANESDHFSALLFNTDYTVPSDAPSPYDPVLGIWLALPSSSQASPAVAPPEHFVRDLPPPPGSATLVLSGLLTLSACSLVRSVQRVDWAAVPDWYHEHAPEQMGCETLFDLVFDTPLVCWSATMSEKGSLPLAGFEFWRQLSLHCHSQARPPSVAARAPPVSSL